MLCSISTFMASIETNSDIFFMEQALAQAKQACEIGEVPIGALVVHHRTVIGSGHNRREELRSPVAHAEILSLEDASQRMGTWRLSECNLYVTLEPCVMCVGAILQARIRRLIFGCLDPKGGAVESLYRLCGDSRLNHRLPVTGGVLAEECAAVLSDFFSKLREQKRNGSKAERWPSPAEGA